MSIVAPERPLDAVLAGFAVSSTIDPRADGDDIVSRLLELAGGNRMAVARALRRVAGRSRAADVLRLTLARGTWAW